MDNIEDDKRMIFSEMLFDQFMERYFDRTLYGGDFKHAPARHLVKTIPTPTRIPKVKFVDIDGTLIQLEELDRRCQQALFMLYMKSKEEDRQWMRAYSTISLLGSISI